MERDPRHEKTLAQVLGLDAPELVRRLAITDPHDPEYIASEVLAAIIRARANPKVGFLDRAAAALYERVMRAVARYFRENPQWDGLVNSSSETLKEATSHAWVGLVTDKASVSLAEVRFWPFVEARTLDHLRSLLAQKNQNVTSLEAMQEHEDGDSLDGQRVDAEEEPDAVLERKMQSAQVNKELMELPPPVRLAVYFRLECQYDWKQVAEFIGCSVPTARKYYKLGIARLKGAM